jgi:hypothetical protein
LRKISWLVAWVLLVLLAATVTSDILNTVSGNPDTLEIAYDDGVADGSTSWSGCATTCMFAVRFTPGASGVLKTVRYYIYSDPAAVKIHIMDENKADLVTPFSSTSSGVGWFDVDVSSLGVSITSGVDFYLALEWISIPYPSLGVDSSSPNSRSYGVVNGVWTLYKIYVYPVGNILVDFMIRAVIALQTTTFGSPIRITTNTGQSVYPSVAAVGSNVYVAWQDGTPVTGSGSNPEIWLRASSNNGASFGSAIRISTNTGSSGYPSVAADGSHVYIAWEDDTPVTGSGSATEIWMRVSSNYGASFGSAIRISTNTGWSRFPSVAATGSYVYVAWQDDTPVTGSGSAAEIWMRASSNSGASFGSPIRISTNTGWSRFPSVAAYGSYVYVAWQDGTAVSGSGVAYEVWLRVSSNSGVSFGSAIRITTNTGFSIYPSVAAVGNYVYVTWQDDTPVTGSGSSPEIWMRVSSNNGASFGSAIRLTTNTGASMYPSVAAVGSYVYVAWQDDTPVTGSGTHAEIWSRVSYNNGASFGSAIRITTNTGNSWDPSVAAAGSYVYVACDDDTPVTGSGTAPEIWLRVGS